MTFVLVAHLTQELTILLDCAIVTGECDVEAAFNIKSTNLGPLLANVNRIISVL